MDFSYSEEQEIFKRTVREFCEKKIASKAKSSDEKGEIPEEVIKDLARMGLLGITYSTDYGGSGADFTTAAIVAEEIARADISMATVVFYLVEAGWGFLFDKYGNQKAKEEILPRVTRGDAFLGIASTEPGGGSDVAAGKTTMEKKGDKYILNGEKTYISGVRETLKYGGGFVTVVKTEPKLKHKGISLCFLPIKDLTGVSTSLFRDMGREGISTGSFTLQDVEIPEYYLIGELNKGFYYAMEGFNCARVLVSAACIGAAEKVLELGIEYLKERELFESKLAKFQGIQFQLAEHYTKLETARLLVYKAAWMLDQWYETKRFTISEINKAVAMAKLIAPTNAFDIIKEVMIWHGAYGYTKEAGFEMGLRGVTSYIIGAEGAQNIMRVIIAREVLGKEFIR